ncbi:MAG: Spy/CpxP family protein refolding chaperone [Candidatus Aminicenantes bacterium]|nr:Spy/CpxP family protein refolding chaperone [Candidatus Aminicenantes bacterium]
MRKNILIIAIGLIFIISTSQVLLAQRYSRDNQFWQRDYDLYDLKLTESQLIKIDELELNLEKEISPLLSKLRLKDLELRQLSDRANPNEQKIESKINEIIKIDDAITEKENSYNEKVRNLLTKEQKAIFDSYYRDFGYSRDFYGRGAGRFGQAGYGRGFYRQGMDRGYGRGYYGQGLGRLGWNNSRGYGRGFYSGIRLGRGPCGRGLGRLTWRNYGYGRGWWK